MTQRAGTRSVPILTYHSLDDSGSVISTSPAVFRGQMQQLSDAGYRAMAMNDLLDLWERDADVPERTVVLTFDDAATNLVDHALPVLQMLRFRATIYAVSGRLGAFNDWPEQGAGIPRLPLMSRDGLVECVDAGCEIGAHSVQHLRLDRLPATRWEKEIVDCRASLESQLGVAVTTFAYPFGALTPAIRNVVATHYRAALSTELRAASPADDRHVLPRVDMYYWRRRSVFPLFGSRAGDAYLSLRAAARRVRASFGSSFES